MKQELLGRLLSILIALKSSAFRLCPLSIKRFWFHGHQRYCTVCQSHVRVFRPVSPQHLDAICPICGSQRRHRLISLFLDRHPELFRHHEARFLHVAPEEFFAARFRRLPGIEYLTADLNNPSAMVHLDICQIPYPVASFDIIFCVHVLEHVPDDRQALHEFYRILKKEGWALFMVPIVGYQTQEDASITDPAERASRYLQHDHVRLYGRDFSQRLAQVGFQVEQFAATDLPDELVTRLGVKGEIIFLCHK
jgi:SAM-dependent methyltransferase